uniref:Putative dehydrogenase n=1 Tax=Aspergillus flavus TaxID=5059 RepID=Q672W4_ASPFL|nr:putative dehydrogenase [Aspergillus flavus]
MDSKSDSPSHPRQFSAIIAGNIDGRTDNVRYRQRQFHRLQASILQHLTELKEAISQDSGHSEEEVQTEVCLSLKEIRSHYSSLNFEKSVQVEYRVARGEDNVDRKKGAGIVYIIPSTHTIFYSVIAALSAALAAGNCIIVEVFKALPYTPVTALLRGVLTGALDSDTFAISESRPDAEFLSTTRVLNQQSSDRLTPSILESPNTLRTVAVVDRTADLQEAAIDLVRARFAFNGSSPYAPDVVLVNQFFMQPFVELVIKHVAKHVGSDNRGSNSLPKRPRQSSVLDQIGSEKGAKVIVSGTGWGVALNLTRHSDSPLLRTKISEKLLLLHPVSSLDDAINLCNAYVIWTLALSSSLKQLTSQSTRIQHGSIMFLMTYLVSRDSHRHPTLLAHSPTDTDYTSFPQLDPSSLTAILWISTHGIQQNTLRFPGLKSPIARCRRFFLLSRPSNSDPGTRLAFLSKVSLQAGSSPLPR